MPVQTISIPGITSTSTLLTVTSSGYTTGDYLIAISPNMIIVAVRSILREEIDALRRREPEFDIDKLQKMINSGDSEMQELANTILLEKTKYSASIIRSLRNGDNGSMESIIDLYSGYSNNSDKLNITGDFRTIKQ